MKWVLGFLLGGCFLSLVQAMERAPSSPSIAIRKKRCAEDAPRERTRGWTVGPTQVKQWIAILARSNTDVACLKEPRKSELSGVLATFLSDHTSLLKQSTYCFECSIKELLDQKICNHILPQERARNKQRIREMVLALILGVDHFLNCLEKSELEKQSFEIKQLLLQHSLKLQSDWRHDGKFTYVLDEQFINAIARLKKGSLNALLSEKQAKKAIEELSAELFIFDE